MQFELCNAWYVKGCNRVHKHTYTHLQNTEKHMGHVSELFRLLLTLAQSRLHPSPASIPSHKHTHTFIQPRILQSIPFTNISFFSSPYYPKWICMHSFFLKFYESSQNFLYDKCVFHCVGREPSLVFLYENDGCVYDN